MVQNELLHAEFRRRFNRIDSKHGKKVNTEEIDTYFNEGYRNWIKIRMPVAKTNNKVRYDLRKLEVIDASLTLSKSKETYVIGLLPDNYYTILRIVPTAAKVGCGENRNLSVSIVQGNDWDSTYKDPYWGPSYLWGRTIADENNQGLRIGLNDSFSIIKCVIDYYKLPTPIYSVELSDCYDTVRAILGTKNVPFELDEMQMDEVLDIAVSFAARDSEDYAKADALYNKVLEMYKF